MLSSLQLGITSVADILQVFQQFSCNAYLHRFRFYTIDKTIKKSLDRILEDQYNSQLTISRLAPKTGIYNVWRSNVTVTPALHSTTTGEESMVQSFAVAAMEEQKTLWKTAEYTFSQFYKNNTLNNSTLDQIKKKVTASKFSYDVIDLKTGKLLLGNHPKINYQFGFDGIHFIELQCNNNFKYSVPSSAKPTNEIILVSDETVIMNQIRLYKSVKRLQIKDPSYIKIKLVQGVLGCGKTTFIINNYKDGDLVLFPTKEGAKDFRERLSQKQPNRDDTKDACRTVHSFLINKTKYMESGGTYKRVIFDEALMMQAGEILYACALANAQEALLIGDINQIPYINRTTHDLTYYDIMKLTTVDKILNHSYRCTNSVAALMSHFYPQGMTTCSSIKKETQTFQLDDIKKLNIDKHEHKVLVFKQSEKLELQKLGYDVSSIHEYQGKQTDHIAVVRTSKIPEEELYNSKPHCIVAITRHRKTFKYFSPVANDTLSEWVKQMNSYSDNDLAKHLRAESHIVSHMQADEHIPLSQSLTLQTHSASTLENTEKGGQVKLAVEILADVLTTYKAEAKLQILMGDVNIDRLTVNTDNTFFEDELLIFGIKRLSLPETRTTYHSRTSIDCICTNISEDMVNFTAVQTGISDHTGQICTVNMQTNLSSKKEATVRRIFSRKNLDILKDEFFPENWESVHAAPDVEESFNLFLTIVKQTLDHVCPKKKVQAKPSRKLNVQYDEEVKILKEDFLTALHRYELTGNNYDKIAMTEKKKTYDLKLRNLKRSTKQNILIRLTKE
ncbi:hypothetical protein J6590_024897 [Homalodisca vitripennis]|nr:hypothetical protein J6590_024897 [Homalodisca vitripennis]